MVERGTQEMESCWKRLGTRPLKYFDKGSRVWASVFLGYVAQGLQGICLWVTAEEMGMLFLALKCMLVSWAAPGVEALRQTLEPQEAGGAGAPLLEPGFQGAFL